MKTFFPQTRVPGAKRRIDPDTLYPMLDKKGRTMWDMPAPVGYAKHTRRVKDKSVKHGRLETVNVPIYRGTTASYARWVMGQIRRNQRKIAEAKLVADFMEKVDADNALVDLTIDTKEIEDGSEYGTAEA